MTGPQSGMVLLLGGARSGKSDLAVTLAERTTGEVVFVATAEALDDDMGARIERHQHERPAHWATVERAHCSATDVDAISPQATVILDCVTMLVSNLMLSGLPADELQAHAHDLANACARRTGTTIVISNEVGMGVVPPTDMGREYRDLLGRVNRSFASAAHESFLVVAGQLLRLEQP